MRDFRDADVESYNVQFNDVLSRYVYSLVIYQNTVSNSDV